MQLYSDKTAQTGQLTTLKSGVKRSVSECFEQNRIGFEVIYSAK